MGLILPCKWNGLFVLVHQHYISIFHFIFMFISDNVFHNASKCSDLRLEFG